MLNSLIEVDKKDIEWWVIQISAINWNELSLYAEKKMRIINLDTEKKKDL